MLLNSLTKIKYRVLAKPYNTTFAPSEKYAQIETLDFLVLIDGLEPSTKYEFKIAGLAELDSITPGPTSTIEVFTSFDTG